MCKRWADARYMGVHPKGDGVIIDDDGTFLLITHDYEYLDECPWCGAKLPDDEHQ